MKLTNETNDEPIYEAENGDSGGGPFPKSCRLEPPGPPRECKNGDKTLGYVGRFANKGDTHNLHKLKNKERIILRFYADAGDTGNDWCQREVVDGRQDYVIQGEACGSYTLTPA